MKRVFSILVVLLMAVGALGCEEDTGTETGDTAGMTGDSDGGGGGGFALAHSGNDIPNNSTYYMLEIDNPESGAVAIFSEQKDPLTITNNSGGEMTINSITIAEDSGVEDEEFEPCSHDSAVNQCLALALGALADGDTFTFYLHFYPIASGERSAIMTINYTTSAGAMTHTVTVKGFGRIGSDENPANRFTTLSQVMHKLWGGYDNNQDEAPGPMVVDGSGNIFIAGRATGLYGSVDGSDRDIFVIKINADGSLGWQKVYHSSFHDEIAQAGDNGGLGIADAMDIDSEGNIYLAGKVANGANTKTMAMIMKINGGTGAEVWTRYWFGNTTRLNYTDAAAAYAVDVEGNLVFFTGTAKSDASTTGIPIVCMSTDGVLHWSKMITPQGTISSAHRGHAIRYDGTGNLWLAGIDYSSGANGAFLARFTNVDAAGTSMVLDFASNYGVGTGSNINSLTLDATGNAYASLDRRGASTYFSVLKIDSSGATIGRDFPGTAGDRNNIHVVRFLGDSVYAGGRVGIAGWDTGNGDGLIVKMAAADLAMQWGAVYYTGTGPNEVCHHSLHGLAVNGTDLYAMGQVYTGNLNYYRYWGYWYDYPLDDAAYSPAVTTITSESIQYFIDMGQAGFVDNTHNDFDNDGALYDIAAGNNHEFQDAQAKNADSNGSATDGDVCIFKFSAQ